MEKRYHVNSGNLTPNTKDLVTFRNNILYSRFTQTLVCFQDHFQFNTAAYNLDIINSNLSTPISRFWTWYFSCPLTCLQITPNWRSWHKRPLAMYQPPSPLTTLQDLPRSNHPRTSLASYARVGPLLVPIRPLPTRQHFCFTLTTSLWFAHNLWGRMMFVPAPYLGHRSCVRNISNSSRLEVP